MHNLRISASVKPLPPGTEVKFHNTPKGVVDPDQSEFKDVARYSKGVVLDHEMRFTRMGPAEYIPFYDIRLPDGRVMRRANHYYFQAGDWPKNRNLLDEAFKLVMKALKPLKLERERSGLRANQRVLRAGSSTVSADKARSLLRTIPDLAMGPAGPNTTFTISMQATQNSSQTFHGEVRQKSMSGDELDEVILDISPQPRSQVYASNNPPIPERAPTMRTHTITASDRSALIRLASSLPAGSADRKAILAGLSKTASGETNIPGIHVLHNAKVSGTAKVYGSAEVGGHAEVYGSAQVFGNARVNGTAKVYGSARVYGKAEVYSSAEVYGDAQVFDKAYMSGRAKVFGNARVNGTAKVYGQAKVYGNAEVHGNAMVGNYAQVHGEARIGGTAVILGGKWDGSEGPILSGTWKAPNVPV